MAISIESLRNLNKMYLIAMGINAKEHPIVGNGPWAAPGLPWHVALYSTHGVKLGGSVIVDNTLGSLVKSITENRLVKAAFALAQGTSGIAPNIDINRKYLYTGVNNLSFQVQGQLLLDSDLVEDYFVPIEKLSYLTFPERGALIEIGDTVKKFSETLQKWVKEKWDYDFSLTNSLGSIYNVLGAAVGKVDLKKAEGEKGFDDLLTLFQNTLGKGYTMQVPPTFNYSKAGSGLDFRYGSILISDVFIKSFHLDVPTLYYQGGYPAAIPITLELETMRPLTATAMTKILMTQAQDTGEGGNLASDNSAWASIFDEKKPQNR